MNRRTLLLTILLSVLCQIALAQSRSRNDHAPAYLFDRIDPERLLNTIRVLSSPAFEGKEMGTPGNDKAIAWIEDTFRSIGLAPQFTDYRQAFPIARYQLKGSNQLRIADSSLALHAQFIPAYYSSSDSITAPVIYAGMGSRQDLTDANLQGKIALIFQDTSRIGDHADYPPFFQQAANAASAGAIGVILVSPPGVHPRHNNTGASYRFEDYVGIPLEAVKSLDNTSMPYVEPKALSIPACFVSSEAAEFIFRAVSAPQPLKETYQERISGGRNMFYWSSRNPLTMITSLNSFRYESANVIAKIEGSKPGVRDAVVLGAHFDQQGQHPVAGAPFFGANRNAASLAIMIEVARIISESRRKPAHDIIFAAFNGGERGYLGAEVFYEDDRINPDYITAHLNMIEPAGGTVSDTARFYREMPVSSPELSRYAQNAVNQFGFDIQPRNLASQVMYDWHLKPALSNNIPSIGLSGGYYAYKNRVQDSPDRLNYMQLFNATHVVMDLAWGLANLDEPLSRVRYGK